MKYWMLIILSIASYLVISSTAIAREHCYMETYYYPVSSTASAGGMTVVWRKGERRKCIEIPDNAPPPPPPPPPPTTPPPPPPPPSPEEVKEKCEKDVAKRYAVCRAAPTQTFHSTMNDTCAKLVTVQIGANGAVINGSISYDAFNVCKSVAEARRDAFYSDCDVNKAIGLQKC